MRLFCVCFSNWGTKGRTTVMVHFPKWVGLTSGGPPLGDELPPSRGARCEYLCLLRDMGKLRGVRLFFVSSSLVLMQLRNANINCPARTRAS
jgi:hypothetical protein